MIIFGNGLGALLGSLSLEGKATQPFLLVIAMWILLLPVCAGYLKLRKMPRPASVSRRRISRLTAYSGLLGTV